MKFKILKFKKVKSTNDTALRIIKKTRSSYHNDDARTGREIRGTF